MNTKQRFSDRVENYIKYRPGYPDEIIPALQLEIGLMSGDIVADIGSGTGISAKIFLENGNKVYGVEPNEPMRNAAEDLLKDYDDFISVEGSSEQTNLEDGSIDLIVCAQAFHWFDRAKTKIEFERIGSSGAHLALMFNDRKASEPFHQGYEKIIQDFSIDYNEVSHRNISEEIIKEFYAPHKYKKFVLDYAQQFDLDGLIGRVLSSSYMPNEDHPNFPQLKNAIVDLFNTHKQNGIVTFAYETSLFIGRLK
ncbi:MAG: methylase involved in ubiquinone/menaquinone biosynthesis [Bacteroidota bacterium]|nr:methylase involved in ubiquinone/menaquinone biosynthesis [Bacteroidota bacterium]